MLVTAAVAQSVERVLGKDEAIGSIPVLGTGIGTQEVFLPLLGESREQER